jgi:hypothetical protein
MNLTRVFHSSSINWETLPELSSRLARHNVTLEKASVTLDKFPDSIEIESLEAAREKVRTGFNPLTYKLTIQCKQDDSLVVISIARTWQVQSGFAQAFCLFGSIDETLLISVADFLGLQRFVLESPHPSRPRTVFIAHRFDELGTSCADKTARFLELLGFRVATGRGYAPISVAEKVRARLLSQAIVIAILTPGDDNTWLAQESVLSESHGKPLIVLRDRSADFKPGILGDLEYIPFVAPLVETVFIPLLEGLRELGYVHASANP